MFKIKVYLMLVTNIHLISECIYVWCWGVSMLKSVLDEISGISFRQSISKIVLDQDYLKDILDKVS